IVRNDDKPGLVANVTALLQKNLINIATMQLYRSGRGDHAVMVIECDEQVPAEAAEELKGLDGINDVIYYRV
ncbi:MAG: ACT domain-containing protein, partial [Lachnospiraceae bacterium]|nr:ACT domain-containing protein [Lachnospiraceae bacterium]